MDSESRFWLSLIGMFVLLICTITVTCGVNFYNTNRMKAEAIAAGRDPLAVYCAFDGNRYDSLCAVLAAKPR